MSGFSDIVKRTREAADKKQNTGRNVSGTNGGANSGATTLSTSISRLREDQERRQEEEQYRSIDPIGYRANRAKGAGSGAIQHYSQTAKDRDDYQYYKEMYGIAQAKEKKQSYLDSVGDDSQSRHSAVTAITSKAKDTYGLNKENTNITGRLYGNDNGRTRPQQPKNAGVIGNFGQAVKKEEELPDALGGKRQQTETAKPNAEPEKPKTMDDMYDEYMNLLKSADSRTAQKEVKEKIGLESDSARDEMNGLYSMRDSGEIGEEEFRTRINELQEKEDRFASLYEDADDIYTYAVMNSSRDAVFDVPELPGDNGTNEDIAETYRAALEKAETAEEVREYRSKIFNIMDDIQKKYDNDDPDQVVTADEKQLLEELEKVANDKTYRDKEYFLKNGANYDALRNSDEFQQFRSVWNREDRKSDYAVNPLAEENSEYKREQWKEQEVYTDDDLAMMDFLREHPEYGREKDFRNYIDVMYADKEETERELERSEKNREKLGASGDVLWSIASVGQNLVSGVGYIDTALQNFRNVLRGEGGYSPVNQNSIWQMASKYTTTTRSGVSEDLNELGTINIPLLGEKGWGDLYQLGMSVADSYAAMMTGGHAGGLLLSGSAATQGIQDAYERGADDGTALLMGTLNGAFESFFETFSIEKLLETKDPKTVSEALKNILMQSLTEGSEEMNTTLANTLADQIVMADKSEIRTNINNYHDAGYTWEQAEKLAMEDWTRNWLWDGIGGAISGGMSSAIRQTSEVAGVKNQTRTENRENGQNIVTNQTVEKLKGIAETLKDGSTAKKLFSKIDAKSSAGKIGKAYRTLLQELGGNLSKTVQETMGADIKKALENSGVVLGADVISHAITNLYSGLQLTEEQRQALAASNKGTEIMKTLLDMTQNKDWAAEASLPVAEEVRQLEDVEKMAEAQPEQTEEKTDQTQVKADMEAAEQAEEQALDLRRVSQNAAKIFDKAKGTAQDVNITGIQVDADGGIDLQISDGNGDTRTVDYRDIAYGTDAPALLVTNAAMYGENAQKVFEAYKPGQQQTAREYVHDFRKAFSLTQSGVSGETVAKSAGTLTAPQVELAIRLGMQNKVERKAAKVTKQGTGTVELVGKAKAYVEGGTLNERQKNEMKMLDALAESLKSSGVSFAVYRSIQNSAGQYVFDAETARRFGMEAGKTVAPNGFYTMADGTVAVDLNAGITAKDTEGSMARTVSHELTHWIYHRAQNRQLVQQMQDFVTEHFAETGIEVYGKNYSFSARVDQIMAHEHLDYDAAVEEVVANACETMLGNSSIAASMRQSNPTLFERIRERIHAWTAAIRKAFAGVNAKSAEAKQLQKDLTAMEKLQKIWDDAAASAMANTAEEENAAEQNGQAETTKNSARIDGYTEEEYNAWGWARANNIILPSEMNRIETVMQNKNKGEKVVRAKTPEGDIVIQTGRERGIDNLVVVIGKGSTVSKIKLERIYRIMYENENDIEELREEIYNAERTHGGDAMQTYAHMYNDAFVYGYNKKDYIFNGFGERGWGEGNGATGRGMGEATGTLQNGGGREETAGQDGTVKRSTREDIESSEAFREWFGDSKVVDENGKPVILYHQTNGDFTVFDVNRKGAGEFDSEMPHGVFMKPDSGTIKLGADYRNSRQMALYSRIENPLRLKNREEAGRYWRKNVPGYAEIDDRQRTLDRENSERFDELDELMYGVDSPDIDTPEFEAYDREQTKLLEDWKAEENRNRGEMKKLLDEYMRSSEYDGIILEADEGTGGTVKTYIALSNTQVKSATDNVGTFSRTDPDIRYSIREDETMYARRDPAQVSDREILANAFESIAVNAEERELLARYKENALAIDKQVEKREKYAERLRGLYEKQAKEELTKSEKQQMEYNRKWIQTLDQSIVSADKRLLKLQHAKPLADLLMRERTRMNIEGRKKLKQEVKEYKRSKEMEHRIEVMQSSIRRGVRKLEKGVSEKTDAWHVPDSFVNAAKEVVAVFKDQTGFWDDKKWAAVQAAYDNIGEKGANSETSAAGLYDEEVADDIKRLGETMRDRNLADITLDELRTVQKIIDNMNHIVENADTVFVDGRKESISALATNIANQSEEKGPYRYNAITDTKRNKLTQLLTESNVTAPYFFRNIGGDVQKLGDAVLKGETKFGLNARKAADKFREIQKAYHYEDWAGKKNDILKLQLADGIVELTREQALGLYATRKRERLNKEQQASHLFTGGIQTEEKIMKRGKYGLKYYTDEARGMKVTEADIDKLEEWLTQEQKNYADSVVRYLSTDMAQLGNEVSLQLHGYSKFGEGYYYPYKTPADYKQTKPGDNQEISLIKSMSFTKRTTYKANTPVVIGNFTETCANHVAQMCMYNAFAVAQDNFYRVYNYKLDKSTTTKGLIRSAWGNSAISYINNFMTDLFGGVRSDTNMSIVSQMISRFKKASVMANLNVAIQQPSSVVRAMAYIDPKYFAKTHPEINPKKLQATWDEMQKYSGTAVVKDMGRFDTGVGQTATEWIGNAIRDESGYRKVMDKIEDAGGKLPELMDKLTWTWMWNAVKAEVNADESIKDDDKLTRAGERFDEVMRLTQVYDSVIAKSQIMRSNDMGAKMITAFMAEPTVAYNMLLDAVRNRKAPKSFKVGAIASVAGATILNAILKGLTGAARDKDEDKSYLEKYLSNVLSSLFGSSKTLYMSGDMNPLTLIPLVQDIISIWDGYDVNRSDMEVVSEIVKQMQTLTNTDKSASERLKSTASLIGYITNVPVKNVWRDMEATVNLFLGEHKSTTAEGLKYSALTALGYDDSKAANAERIVEAVMDGDDEAAKETIRHMREYTGMEDKDIASKIRTAAKEAYLDGADADAITKLLTEYCGMDDNSAYYEIDKWEASSREDYDGSYSKYDALLEAVQTGKGLKEAIKDLRDHGAEASSIASAITSGYKAEYVSLYETDRKAAAELQARLLTAYEAAGYDREKKKKDIAKWVE